MNPCVRLAAASFLFLVSLITPMPNGRLAFGQFRKASGKAVVASMEARYRKAQTLQATFLEHYMENGQLIRSEAGMAYFKRPGKMRWEYEAPEKNIFLVDGKTAWFYVPADHTVTRVPAKQSTDWRTPLALLAGEMKVSRVCAQVQISAEETPETAGNVILRCALRSPNRDETTRSPDSQPAAVPVERVLFEIAPATGDLVRILVHQAGGSTVEFRFTHWQIDPPLPPSLFRFDPPLGVAIVNGELPAGNASEK